MADGTYTLSIEIEGKQGYAYDNVVVYASDISTIDGGIGHHDGPYSHSVTFTLTDSTEVRVMAKCYAPARYRLMLVEGDIPAAWAPAEGEELSGGVLS